MLAAKMGADWPPSVMAMARPAPTPGAVTQFMVQTTAPRPWSGLETTAQPEAVKVDTETLWRP